jgi:hypothetical protein
MTAVTPQYLDLLDAQREAIFAELRGAKLRDALWRRPQPQAWSMGEHLDHAAILLRSFRRLLRILWPLQAPYARLRRARPYVADIDDVYARPNFPLNVGWMWPPKYNAQRPTDLTALYAQTAVEHQAIRAFFSGKDEWTMGNFYLYDPAIGWLNMVQMLRVGVHHDEHHFQQVRQILQAAAVGETTGV